MWGAVLVPRPHYQGWDHGVGVPQILPQDREKPQRQCGLSWTGPFICWSSKSTRRRSVLNAGETCMPRDAWRVHPHPHSPAAVDWGRRDRRVCEEKVNCCPSYYTTVATLPLTQPVTQTQQERERVTHTQEEEVVVVGTGTVTMDAVMRVVGVEDAPRRYWLGGEVGTHNREHDCWVSAFGVVFDLTALVQAHKGALTEPLVRLAGRDVSHWFHPHDKTVQPCVGGYIPCVCAFPCTCVGHKSMCVCVCVCVCVCWRFTMVHSCVSVRVL